MAQPTNHEVEVFVAHTPEFRQICNHNNSNWRPRCLNLPSQELKGTMVVTKQFYSKKTVQPANMFFSCSFPFKVLMGLQAQCVEGNTSLDPSLAWSASFIKSCSVPLRWRAFSNMKFSTMEAPIEFSARMCVIRRKRSAFSLFSTHWNSWAICAMSRASCNLSCSNAAARASLLRASNFISAWLRASWWAGVFLAGRLSCHMLLSQGWKVGIFTVRVSAASCIKSLGAGRQDMMMMMMMMMLMLLLLLQIRTFTVSLQTRQSDVLIVKYSNWSTYIEEKNIRWQMRPRHPSRMPTRTFCKVSSSKASSLDMALKM